MLLLLAMPFGGLLATGVLVPAALALLVVPASIPGYNLIWPIAVALAF
ncbi:MAG TPA: hypothetical protein VEG44_01225 [Candidatus Acidoferrales bacterium]|nr:hypothetical protein [Candidatus Acidoferrales bacterium]